MELLPSAPLRRYSALGHEDTEFRLPHYHLPHLKTCSPCIRPGLTLPARMQIPSNLLQTFATGLEHPQTALTTAFEQTSGQLNDSVSGDELSGAQVITAFVQGRNVHLASIGDCSAVVAEKHGVLWRPSLAVQAQLNAGIVSGPSSPRCAAEQLIGH